jgi:hypothetical protein
MLKWLQGLLPSRGAVVINRSVLPNFLNFLIRVKQPYIHTHSLTHSNEKVSSQSLTHPCSFTCVNGFTYSLKLQCLFVCLCGQCLEDSSSHCPFSVECFRGWEGQHRRGRGGGTGGEGPGGGELDGCIMHRVHTSHIIE